MYTVSSKSKFGLWRCKIYLRNILSTSKAPAADLHCCPLGGPEQPPEKKGAVFTVLILLKRWALIHCYGLFVIIAVLIKIKIMTIQENEQVKSFSMSLEWTKWF